MTEIVSVLTDLGLFTYISLAAVVFIALTVWRRARR